MKSYVPAFLLLAAMAASAQTAPPVVSAGGVASTAGPSTGQAVAPGSLVSIFGTNLASSMAASGTVPLSTTLSGVSVTFNNTPAPVQFVSNGQINVQLPWGLALSTAAGGPAQVVVTRDDGATSAPVGVQVLAIAPAIYNL